MGTLTEPKQKTLKVKVAADVGERTIVAVVSSSNFDRDNERVDVKSLRLPLRGGGTVVAKDLTGTEAIDIPMLLNHSFDVEDVIGSVRKAYLNQSGELVVEFGISGRAKAQDLMQLIDEKHLDNAFSITMSDYQYSEDTIYNAEVVEISMVFRGSNKDARVLQVKSLIKGEEMAELTLDEKKAELERLKKEIEVEEPVVEPPKEEEPVAEPEVEEPKPVEEKTIKPKKEKTMSKENDIAVKQVTDVPVQELQVKKVTVTKKEQRELFVKQFLAYKAKDLDTLAELNEKAYEADTSEDRDYKKKAIGFTDGAAIFQTEVVSQDIKEAYTNVGRLGSMVNHVDILGAETWKRLVQTAGNGFQPVGDQEAKAEDKPVWTNFSVEPKEFALIVAWYDAVARRTPIAIYGQIVSYIAKEWAKLEDKIIVSFAGATTVGGDTFPATGIVPAMIAAGRIVNVATFGAADTQAGLGRAYGLIESDEQITIIANRKTWGMMATTVDTQGRNVFTVVGQQVSAGALGTFNVVISQYVPDGNAIMGVMGDYDLVTRGGLETLFSREASVGSLNLYTSDASALRANADIVGKPVLNTSFVLIDFVPVVS
jgi:HK97 family phage major capsid protein